MKFKITNYTIFFIFLSNIISPCNINSQSLFELPGAKNRIIKFRPANIVTITKENRIRLLKSIGIKIGFTTNEYGWHHPFAVITNNYHDARISTASIGAYFEGLSSRFYSTVIDAAYNRRSMKFDIDLYDENGNVISSNTSENSYGIYSLCISEKVKFSNKVGRLELDLYGFGGLKYNYISSSEFDWRVEPFLINYRKDTYGFTAGLGISIGKRFRFSADIYYSADFTNIYETELGNYKNAEIGITAGFGLMNF